MEPEKKMAEVFGPLAKYISPTIFYLPFPFKYKNILDVKSGMQ